MVGAIRAISVKRVDWLPYAMGGLTIFILGAFLVHYIYKKVPWIDRHLERAIVKAVAVIVPVRIVSAVHVY